MAAANNSTVAPTYPNECMKMSSQQIDEAYVYSVIVLFTILNNILLIVVMRRQWNNTNIMMCSMCVSCILFAIFYLLPRKILIGTLHCDPIYCAFISLLGQTFVIMMNLHLCVVSLDKYLAITAPLHYRSIVNRTRVIITLVAVYVLSIVSSFLPLIWRPVFTDRSRCWTTANNAFSKRVETIYYYVFFIVLFFVPLGIMLITYGRIYFIARDHHIRSQSSNKSLYQLSQQNSTGRLRKKSIIDTKFKNIKAARTLALVVGAFFLFWLPYIIAFFVFNVRDQVQYQVWELRFIQVTVFIAYTYPAINPIIYGYFNSHIRRSAVNMVRRRGRRESTYSTELPK